MKKELLHKVVYRERHLTKKETTEIWEQIQVSNLHNRKKRLSLYWISAAASVILLFGVGGYTYLSMFSEEIRINYAQIIEQGGVTASDSIQLLLANQDKVLLAEEDALLQYDKQGKLKINEEEAVFHSEAAQVEQKKQNENVAAKSDLIEEEKFNQLVVPVGKRSQITLSDGTKVWVNSNTRVIYPIAFSGETREIYVDGEVFLDVVPDKKHPFVVTTKQMDVRVLGTSFNVSAYSKAREVSVVLVTGRVEVKTDNKDENILKPKQMLSYSHKRIRTKTVDTEKYTSWIDGKYAIDSESLGDVLDRLSSYYDTKFKYDSQVSLLKCSGILNLRDNLDDILHILEGAHSSIVFVKEAEYIKVIVESNKRKN